MGGKVTKQKMTVDGESILFRSVKAFSDCTDIDYIVVVGRAEELEWIGEELKGFSKIHSIVSGGKTRAESARIGFFAIPDSTDYVAIHDAARCLITKEQISAVVEKAIEYGAASACSKVVDTVKLIDNGKITKTIPRELVVHAETPQIFKRSIYANAIESVPDLSDITDDNMMLELMGEAIYAVNIGKHNIKITTAEDIEYAEYILARRNGMSETRIGHGYDVHRLVEGRELVLGGVKIPYALGLLGHSDADVLLHAIMDSLLGACALGDIGRHFPDSEECYKGISSLELLGKVNELIMNNGFSITNIDATLVIQSPKIAPYISDMINNIAKVLKIESGRINIKATTEEKLGFTGRGEGVSAHSVALVRKK